MKQYNSRFFNWYMLTFFEPVGLISAFGCPIFYCCLTSSKQYFRYNYNVNTSTNNTSNK